MTYDLRGPSDEIASHHSALYSGSYEEGEQKVFNQVTNLLHEESSTQVMTFVDCFVCLKELGCELFHQQWSTTFQVDFGLGVLRQEFHLDFGRPHDWWTGQVRRLRWLQTSLRLLEQQVEAHLDRGPTSAVHFPRKRHGWIRRPGEHRGQSMIEKTFLILNGS